MTTPVPFATDQPIATSADDRFSRKPFAYRIAHTIAYRSDPSSIVVGIYGAWGEGKTSVLKMIDEALAAESNVKTFWFNPWRYSDEETLLEQFFRSMATALGSSLSSKTEELGGLLRRYRKILTPALMLGGAVAKSLVGVAEPMSDTFTSTAEQVDAVADTLSDVDAETLKQRIDKRLAASNVRLVVFMDDLDRLDQQEIRDVFRLVKLTLSFENTAFVLAFDDEVVEQALGFQYGTASRKFLEKIIQVPLQLPRTDALILRQFCFKGVEEALELAEIELSDGAVRRFVQTFDSAFLSQLKTPRMARRYANTLAFSLPILKDEVDSVDLMLIEAVRVFYPRLYSSIRSNRDLYVWSMHDHLSESDKDFRTRKQQAILACMKDLGDEERDAAISVITALFPRNVGVLTERNVSYSDEIVDSWNVEKRVASPQYFDRYFGYGVPSNDIADAEFERFVASLKTSTCDEVAAELTHLCENGRSQRFLEKVRLAAKSLGAGPSRLLAIAIGASSDLFSRSQSDGLTDLEEDAAIRIFWLLQRVAPADRFTVASECIRVAQHPHFAIQVARWLRADEEKEDYLITVEEQYKLRVSALDQVRAIVNGTPVWQVFGRETASVLYEWMSVAGKDETSKYLMTLFESKAQNVLTFLEVMLSNAKQMFTNRPMRRAFSADNYGTVSAVVDAEGVANIVRSLGFVAELGHSFEQPTGPPEEQTARRFLALHLQAQAASAKG